MHHEGLYGDNSPRYKGQQSNYSPMPPQNFHPIYTSFDHPHPMTPSPPFYYPQPGTGAGCSSPRFSTPNNHHNTSSSYDYTSDSSPQQRSFGACGSPSPNADFMRIDRSGSDFGRGRNHQIRTRYRPPWPYRGRRFHSPRHGSPDQTRFRSPVGNNPVECYVKPSFLEDPWAELVNKRKLKKQEELKLKETPINNDTNQSISLKS